MPCFRSQNSSGLGRLLRIAISLVAISVAEARAEDRIVASPEAFAAALGAARPGDRILLAPGAYGEIVIDGRAFSPPVEIGSADERERARIDSIVLTQTSGVRFRGLDILAGPGAPHPQCLAILVDESRDIGFEDVLVAGAPDGLAGNDGLGVMLRRARGVTIRDSFFSDLLRGVAIRGAETVEIAGNRFERMGSDAVAGGGLVDARISDNLITHFALVDRKRFHPDGIQLWDLEEGPRNDRILIERNLILQGEGDAAQGIFINTPRFAATGLIIRNNVVHQSAHQGLFVGNAEEALIAANTVLPFRADAPAPAIAIRKPGARVRSEDNLAEVYRTPEDWAGDGDIVFDSANPFSDLFVDTFIAEPFMGPRAIPADFSALTKAGAQVVARLEEGALKAREAQWRRTLALYDSYSEALRSGSAAGLNGPKSSADACRSPDASSLRKSRPGLEPPWAARHATPPVRENLIAGFDFDGSADATGGDGLKASGAPAGWGQEGEIRFVRFSSVDSGFLRTEPSRTLTAAQDVTLAARVRFKGPMDGRGVIAAIPKALQLRRAGDRLEAIINRPNGARIRAVSEPIARDDAAWRDIRVDWRGATGELILSVDGAIVARASGEAGPLRYVKKGVLMVGGTPWAGAIDGDIDYLMMTRETAP